MAWRNRQMYAPKWLLMDMGKVGRNMASDTLKKLLLLVAFRAGQSPSRRNIYKILEGALAGGGSPQFTEDNIKSYLEGSTPGADKGKSILKAINLTLFGSTVASYFKNLSDPPDGVAAWDEYRNAIDHYLSDQSQHDLNIGGVLVVPDYDEIDPAEIDIQIKHANKNNTLKAHLLYHSPVAAYKWDSVKKSPSYEPLYKLCEEGLTALLRKKSLKDRLRGRCVVFNLGAGSASKDDIILTSLIEATSPEPTFAWVDASYPMLHRTIKKISRNLLQNVDAVALLTDFEKPGNIRKTYDNYVRKVHSVSSRRIPNFKDAKKVFFILGYTLSNLDEESFFSEYAKVCSPGDLFIFPMQFIPKVCKDKPDELVQFRSQLLGNYNFPEGRDLSHAGLALLQEYEPTASFIDPIVGDFIFDGDKKSQCVRFFVELKHKDSEDTKTVVTARSIRHYEEDYMTFLKSNGFEKLDESQECNGVKTLAVQYIGRHAPQR